MESILLHCCCAPCSTQPIELLRAQGYQLALWYGNLNIAPKSEYQRRRDCLMSYATAIGLTVEAGEYRPHIWSEAIGERYGVFPLIEGADDYEQNLASRHDRCRACYRQRFGDLADKAVERGFAAISTTLSVSPWQFTDILAEELAAVASERGLQAHFEDWRAYYQISQQVAMEKGFYFQNYCGCAYSREESRLEREALRQKLREAKRKRRATKPAQKD